MIDPQLRKKFNKLLQEKEGTVKALQNQLRTETDGLVQLAFELINEAENSQMKEAKDKEQMILMSNKRLEEREAMVKDLQNSLKNKSVKLAKEVEKSGELKKQLLALQQENTRHNDQLRRFEDEIKRTQQENVRLRSNETAAFQLLEKHQGSFARNLALLSSSAELNSKYCKASRAFHNMEIQETARKRMQN